MKQALEGMRALVTGGSRGIGRACAEALAAAGARVVIVYHGGVNAAREESEALGAMPNTDPPAHAIRADVSDEEQAVAAVAEAVGHMGGIDLLVNCAGILEERALTDTTAADFDRVIGVNLRGTFLMGREVIRRFQAQDGRGRVINIGSDLGALGRPGNSAYSASKAGIAALTRCWAREFGPDILVNTVAPGPIATAMLSPDVMSAESLAEETRTPLARIGEPREIADVVVFLAGPGATFITGQTLGVNGGSSM
jgi:3-oxoacyl-[acyl-carrier protein] reductase